MLICKKTMRPCTTEGMCAPFQGCGTIETALHAQLDRIAALEGLLRDALQDLEDCTCDEGPEQFELNRARKTLDRIRAALKEG
jgi:hypothetical protein